jgi:hypothetical protein
MTARRDALRKHHLVYILAVNWPHKYKKGRSKIVYIGTTKVGISRIAASVAYRAKSILHEFGVKRIAAFVLTYNQSSGTKMWLKLERATLMTFKGKYGSVPYLNKHGKNYKSRRVFHYFTEDSLRKKLLTVEQMRI